MLRVSRVYETLETLSVDLAQGLAEKAAAAGVPARVNRVGRMLTLFFTGEEVTDFESAKSCDTDAFARFFSAMLTGGVLLPPSQFEAWFVSGAHADMHIRKTLDVAERAFREV
jgi:glutamate-1-semialdehyde 2,1-aminomutase